MTTSISTTTVPPAADRVPPARPSARRAPSARVRRTTRSHVGGTPRPPPVGRTSSPSWWPAHPVTPRYRSPRAPPSRRPRLQPTSPATWWPLQPLTPTTGATPTRATSVTAVAEPRRPERPLWEQWADAAAEAGDAEGERLQKVLARAGYGSRRTSEE